MSVFGKKLYFRDSEIDRMCLEALKKGGFYPGAPAAIDIESFVESYFETNLDMGSDVGDGVLGWTLFDKKGAIKVVGVSSRLAGDTSQIGLRRCRATVAHEAGHCLMHPILFMEDTAQLFENIDFEQRRILCRKEDIAGKYNGRWWEVQANKAIGGFLLPRALVISSVQHLMKPAGLLGMPSLLPEDRQAAISHVAETFEVNLKPAEIRLAAIFPAEAS